MPRKKEKLCDCYVKAVQHKNSSPKMPNSLLRPMLVSKYQNRFCFNKKVRRTKMMKKIGLLALMLPLLAAPAAATIGHTYQCWTFNAPSATGSSGLLADINQNPFGTPVALIGDTGGDGVFRNSGGYWEGQKFNLVLNIPNQRIPNDHKDIEVNMSYRGNIDNFWIIDSFGTLYTQPANKTPGDPIGDWNSVKYNWQLRPNPDWEVLIISFGGQDTGAWAAIDQICVETWCIPEPATLAVFGVGAAVMLRLRKKA